MKHLILLLILSLFEPSTANAQATNDMPDTHKLGMALDYFAGGKYHEALMMFLKIDKKYKLNPRFKAYIGVCYYHEWEYEEACKYLDEAIPELDAFAKSERNVYYNVAAESHFELKEYDEALGLFFNALEKDRTCGEYAVNIAETLVLMHRDTPDKALQIAQNWVKNYPENPLAHHTLASFGGSSPAYDSAYSRTFFDNFASGYEETLSHLNYCLPQKIKQLLETVKGTVLDLGCGTGLIAETLASADNHFIGVDISSQMLEIARSKQLYQELINQDILAYLQSRPLPRPDLIIAADVFCYMAELGPVFNLCAPCPLCFSIEKGTANSSCLMPSGRYTHHPDYIKHLLTSAGYSKINQYDIILRQENHQDVPGLIYIAR